MLDTTAKLLDEQLSCPSLEIIPENRFSKLTSSYLTDGFRQDFFKLNSVKHKSGFIEIDFRVTDYYPSTDNSFHLSAVAAQILFQQSAIILIHLDYNLEEKTKEIYITQNMMHYRKMISSRDIKFTLELTSKKIKKGNLFFSGDFMFNDGAFYGDATGIFPIN
ncbi:hypothetical protein [Pleionea sediminis]|uniref:hypothetical protein n=1 Tax=Pleionea sediminis TaxID=2569479 RepID=UPI001186235B|nr:hypothetical protein [Pleionea sediminis]